MNPFPRLPDAPAVAVLAHNNNNREHNTGILRRMVLEDGSVLKPPSNALPCLKSLFVDPQRDPDALLSIWNECDAPGHGVLVRQGRKPPSLTLYMYGNSEGL